MAPTATTIRTMSPTSTNGFLPPNRVHLLSCDRGPLELIQPAASAWYLHTVTVPSSPTDTGTPAVDRDDGRRKGRPSTLLPWPLPSQLRQICRVRREQH